MPDTDTPTVDPLIAERDASMADMERDAAALFAAKDATRIGAPAPEPAAPPAAKPAAAPTPPPKTGKVSGPPTPLAPPKVEPKHDAPPAKPDAAPPADPFSDVTREYPTGKVTSKNWSRLHEKIDAYEARALAAEKAAAELQARMASPDAAPPEVAQRLTALQQERDALQARLEAVAVERSPRFEAAFKPRQEAAIAQAKAAVGPAQADRVAALLALPESTYRDEQLDAVLAELGTGVRSAKLSQAVADLDRLSAERTAMASRGSELFKTWTAEEQAARDAANARRTAEANAAFEAELPGWQSLLSPEQIAQARALYQGKDVTLQEAANTAYWAVAGPSLHKTAMEANARVAELEAELSKLRRVQPTPTADTGGPAPELGSDPDDNPNASYMDRVAQLAVQQGFLRR